MLDLPANGPPLGVLRTAAKEMLHVAGIEHVQIRCPANQSASQPAMSHVSGLGEDCIGRLESDGAG